MRSSRNCCFSRTSSWTIATWIFFSSLASASICRKCWISVRSSSCRTMSGCPLCMTIGWAGALGGGSREAVAKLGEPSNMPTGKAEDPGRATSCSISPVAAAAATQPAPPLSDERSSGTSQAPQSIRFLILGAFCCTCGALSMAAEANSSGQNIRKASSSSSSMASASLESSKNHSSSTAWVAFLLAIAFARAFSLASASFAFCSSMTFCLCARKPFSCSSVSSPLCSVHGFPQCWHFSFLNRLGAKPLQLSVFSANSSITRARRWGWHRGA
mmetsp:Transcript_7385/g.22539  ORF Transcript_7385/g.22539 Transcript_7385/m.22539 type:complete len:272 (-) Transcript_7385:10-825(-)